jgi:ABC-2 type transport system permease protein
VNWDHVPQGGPGEGAGLSFGMTSRAGILLGVKAASFRGAAASEWADNRLKVLAGGLTILILMPGMYLLFRFLFGYVYSLESTFPGFGEALARRLLGMTLLSFGIFIAISSFISGVSILFRSAETTFLMTLPVPDRLVSTARTLESWLHAGWATVLMGSPILIAFCVSLGYGFQAAALSVFLLPLLVAPWVGAGTILLGLSVRIGRNGRHWRTAAVLSLMVAAGILLALKGSGPSGILAEDSSSLDALQRFVAQLPASGGVFWPHSLYCDAVVAAGSADWGRAAFHAGLLAVEAAVFCLLSLTLICPGFRRIHSAMSRGSVRCRSSRMLLRGGGRLRSMMHKDLLSFIRDPVQWSQLLLLTGLFLVYAFNLERFPMDIGHPLWRSVVVFLNFSFSSFVAATLLVRFAFPAVSLEGPGLSYVLQLPAGRELLLRSKWLGSFSFILPLIAGTGLWTTFALGAGTVMVISTTAALVFMCLALVSINTGLGAVFPRFERGSAASIASGQGGIIAAFASMGYVLMAVSLLGLVVRTGFPAAGSESVLAAPMTKAILALAVVTCSAGWWAMSLGLRSLRKRNF